jgi:hypothetical protein
MCAEDGSNIFRRKGVHIYQNIKASTQNTKMCPENGGSIFL